jgi:DTW domain-containing protein YfiP
MPTRTRFVFLMHPKEFKQEKAATGRLTHLCLPNSTLHVGVSFDEHEDVQNLLRDPAHYPVLLYPGPLALNLSDAATSSESTAAAEVPSPATQLRATLGPRRLAVILLDATWSLGRKMLRLSATLQKLPRVMFTPSAPSRYVIKQQPHPACLSTLEATHELLLALERAGLDAYSQPEQLLGLFQRMQDFQLRCAADPNRTGYRHRAYRPPAERKPAQGRSGARRQNMFKSSNAAAGPASSSAGEGAAAVPT